MVEIRLGHGIFTAIDEEDSDLGRLTWTAQKTKIGGYYAVRGAKRIFLHRIILGRKIGRELVKGEFTDHINQNTLDNHRKNLRLSDYAGNSRNRKKFETYGDQSTTSRFKGVTWDKRKNRWKAYIIVNKKNKSLGSYLKEENAARAYNKAAKAYFGEFACLNYI